MSILQSRRVVTVSSGGSSVPTVIGTTRTRFYANIDNGAAITVPRVLLHRQRMFLGAATDYSTLSQTGAATFGWLGPTTGPSYLPRDASLAVVTEDANIAISGSSRSSDVQIGQVAIPIGIAGFGLADANASSAWGGYFEAIRQGTNSFAIGVEADVRNCSTVATSQPYSIGLHPHGLWVACGPGDGSGGYGPAPTADSGAGMVILQNATGSNAYKFTKGIIIKATALSGVTGVDAEATRAGAIEMGRGQEIRWYSADGSIAARMSSRLDDADPDWSVEFSGNDMNIARNATTEIAFQHAGVVSAVNYIRSQNSVAGSHVSLDCVGSDTDIHFNIVPKGAGNARTNASLHAKSATAIPAGGTAGAGVMVSSTANFGMFFGSGAPSLSAAQGSWYLRSDGSAPNNRAYINTDGSTAYEIVPTTVEGTFTPAMSFATVGSSTWAFSVQTGTYTKIGRLVTFALTVAGTPTIGTGSGDLQISLPFTCSATLNVAINADNLGVNFTWPAGRTSVAGRVNAGTAIAVVRSMGSGVATAIIGAANMTTGASHTVNLAGAYEV